MIGSLLQQIHTKTGLFFEFLALGRVHKSLLPLSGALQERNLS